MSGKGSLRDFLDSHKAEGVWTHGSLGGIKGSYFIPEDDLETFYNLYSEQILDGEKVHLTEKRTNIGPLCVDFDFIYDKEIKTHKHTRAQVMQFVKLYMDEMANYLVLSNPVDVYIMEKRKPTLDKKKDRMKSGIHIVVPSVCSHKFVEQRVRRSLIKHMDSVFEDLPVTEPWDKIYDDAVANRSGPWMLYGSRKGEDNSLPYLVSYIVKYNSGEVDISPDKIEPSIDLIKLFSMRRPDSDETAMTEEAKAIYSSLNTANSQSFDVKISGGRAVTPSRGRPAARGEKPGSRGSSPDGRIVKAIDPEYKEYIRAHVMNLSVERAKSYSEWVNVALCLHNMHPDLLDVFLDFSSQDDDKYNEADCIQKWNSLTFRNDGDRLGMGTLRYWSKTDNPEGYLAIEQRNIERLMLDALSGTEHDVACVVHSKFRDEYKCTDFGKNVWYRWSGHIWQETDRGVDLQLKVSRAVATDFKDKSTAVDKEAEARGLKECISPKGKEACNECEFCQLEKQSIGFVKIWTKLKTTKFKDNIMKECRELFFDEHFTKKVDSNKDLIAFNNGILDLTTFEFRNGRPEDYISFSTGIDYEPEKMYYEYESWPAIEKFINQVLPDPDVRSYFIKHLATCLVGGNKAQKFHIMTGSGSNGKSMLMNLTSKALGDYAAVVPISLFTQKRNKSAAAAPEVIRLKGRRFVTMQEPDEKIALNTGLMKEISSCEKMYARDLFKSGCEFEVQAKFHLACNEKPEINSTDGGTWRRLIVVNFISKFVEKPTESNHFPLDESIQYVVNSPEWATPFLNFLVTTLKEGKGFHKLSPPEKVLEYTSEYRNENDAIARFMSEKLAGLDPDDEIKKITKESIRSVFKQWKVQNDQAALSAADMEKRLVALYGNPPRGGWDTFKIVET
jgi:P4 family phage/plasmid primase-like protien